MSAAASPPQIPPAERLARLIDGLCVAIAARGIGGLLTAPLIFLLWGRLKRAASRARRLAEKLAAHQPLAGARRRHQSPRPGRPSPPRLPRGYAWVIRLVPAAAPAASQLRALLTDPDMAALARQPPMRRLLRPLCQMLGVEPPPVPKRPAAMLENPRPPVGARRAELHPPAAPASAGRGQAPPPFARPVTA